MLKLSLDVAVPRTVTGGGGGSGPVTAVTVLADISIAITSPSSMSVPMQTNGTTIKVNTSDTAAYTAVDLTKVTLTVTDLGFDTSGNETTRTRTVGLNGHLYGPYNEANVYQPNLGEFYFKLSNRLYNQDAKWFSTVTAVNFAAGWYTGAPAQTLTTSITRNDTLPYDPVGIGAHCPFFQRVASGGTLPVEFTAVSRHVLNASHVACFEAWAVDSASTAGAVARGSTFTRSANTPADATLVGKPAPTFLVNVDPAGLLAGRCEVRWACKPWIGPPSFGVTTTYAGTSITGVGVTIQTVGPIAIPAAFPFGYDTDASHAPIYGILVNDPASPPGGTTVIASQTTVASASVIGLSTTMAGAIASGQAYANLATLMIAVRKLNNSGSNLLIADPVTGLPTSSYKRTTAHDDISGGVAVCLPVTGSVLGADLGCYSMRVTTATQSGTNAAYPPGITMFEIRSQTGLPTDDVRWRGRDSAGGGVTASISIASRVRLRGLSLDSTAISTAAQNSVFDGGTTAGAPTSARTELNAAYAERIDCRLLSTTSVTTGSAVHVSAGQVWDTRVEVANQCVIGELNQGTGILSGMVSSIGSNYHIETTSAGAALTSNQNVNMPACILGAKLKNIGFIASVLTSSIKGMLKGPILFNVDMWSTVVGNPSNAMLTCNNPITGMGWVNVLVHMDTTSTAMANAIGITNDDTYTEIYGANFYGVAVALPNISTTSNSTNDTAGRVNVIYQDQGKVRINKDASFNGLVCRSYNTKGDTLIATVPNTPPAWGSTTAYWKGAMVSDSSIYYQALSDIPASSGILVTNATYWQNNGATGVATGGQPLRQGNGDFRDGVDSDGNVFATSAAGTSFTSTSWYGRANGPNTKIQATFTNFWNSPGTGDFTPKPGGELVSRIAAGKAWSPIDLNGVAIPNDGTGAAGPLQIP